MLWSPVGGGGSGMEKWGRNWVLKWHSDCYVGQIEYYFLKRYNSIAHNTRIVKRKVKKFRFFSK